MFRTARDGSLCEIHAPDGCVGYMEGPYGDERLLKIEWPTGRVVHYSGPAGRESVCRIEYRNGLIEHYDGSVGEEVLVAEEKHAWRWTWTSVWRHGRVGVIGNM